MKTVFFSIMSNWTPKLIILKWTIPTTEKICKRYFWALCWTPKLIILKLNFPNNAEDMQTVFLNNISIWTPKVIILILKFSNNQEDMQTVFLSIYLKLNTKTHNLQIELFLLPWIYYSTSSSLKPRIRYAPRARFNLVSFYSYILLCLRRSANYNNRTNDCELSDMDRLTVAGKSTFEQITKEGKSDTNPMDHEYLENNCIDEPIKLCEFKKLSGRILKTVDSVYQEVGSAEECRELCLNSPYRCHSYDYGDTGELVCRLSHHSRATLTDIQVRNIAISTLRLRPVWCVRWAGIGDFSFKPPAPSKSTTRYGFFFNSKTSSLTRIPLRRRYIAYSDSVSLKFKKIAKIKRLRGAYENVSRFRNCFSFLNTVL